MQTPTQSVSATSAVAPAAPVIEARNLCSFYGTRQVLFDINLAVQPGEIMVIMGHSGCGKTTLFRHLLALKKQTSGDVLNMDSLWESFLGVRGVFHLAEC